jgi:hypothetical protein
MFLNSPHRYETENQSDQQLQLKAMKLNLIDLKQIALVKTYKTRFELKEIILDHKKLMDKFLKEAL